MNVSGKPEHFTRMTIGENVQFDGDPGFLDIEDNDLSLRDDAELTRRMPSFARIAFGDIGLLVDEWRSVLPARGRPRGDGGSGLDSTEDMEACPSP